MEGIESYINYTYIIHYTYILVMLYVNKLNSLMKSLAQKVKLTYMIFHIKN